MTMNVVEMCLSAGRAEALPERLLAMRALERMLRRGRARDGGAVMRQGRARSQ